MFYLSMKKKKKKKTLTSLLQNSPARKQTKRSKISGIGIIHDCISTRLNQSSSWLGPELLVCCLAHRGPTGVFLLLRS